MDSEAGGISYEAASASEISYDATPVVQAGAGVEASARPFSLPLARSWILVAPLKALIAPPVDVAVQQPGNIQASSAPALEGEGFLLLDRENWALLNRVNRMVNRRIRQASDQSVFGQADYWQAPVGDGAYGDCEDYVLAKRQALIEAGVPEAALSIAIVETRWGESHAVLLVTGETGEVVLDSLSSWISRWDRVDYVWRERQAPGKVFEWVTIAT